MSYGYQALIAWQKAMDLVELVYHCTEDFPSEERFGLTSQVRRAAVSIPSNIAEGNSRSSDRDFARFLEIALGSLAEVETQLILAKRLRFLAADKLETALSLSQEVGRITGGLLRSKLAPDEPQ